MAVTSKTRERVFDLCAIAGMRLDGRDEVRGVERETTMKQWSDEAVDTWKSQPPG